MASDDLADYNSEEDEDYVPEEDVDDEPAWTGKAGGRAASGGVVGKKRKAGASDVPLPKRVPMGATKRKGQARIRAAVLSDDEGDDLMQPPPPPSAPPPEPPQSEPPVAELPPSPTVGKASPAQLAEAAASDSVDASTQASAEPAAVSEPAIAAPSDATAFPSPPPAASATPSSAAATAPAAAAKKSDDLASILAQFNKKSTKPAVKKVINAWEQPTKPKPAPSVPLSSSSTIPARTSSTSAAAASASPAERVLSTEQLQVTEYTSFAGEALAVTRTVIKGSTEDVAHRQQRQDGLQSLVASLSARRSINTLEKSRIDWSVSKQIEGDEDELKAFVDSKDAVVEKMAFLARADRRQWEKQKEARDRTKPHAQPASLAGVDD